MERDIGIVILVWFFLLMVALTLSGCKHTPATETIADSAKETISQAYNNLPKECQTESTRKAMEKAQKEIDAVVVSCETEKRAIEAEAHNRLLRTWLIGLVVAIIALIGLRVRGLLRW